MEHRANTPLEQIFWHLSVVIHHLQAALAQDQDREVLTPVEYVALEAMGHAIGTVSDRLTTMWEDDTTTMDDPPANPFPRPSGARPGRPSCMGRAPAPPRRRPALPTPAATPSQPLSTTTIITKTAP